MSMKTKSTIILTALSLSGCGSLPVSEGILDVRGKIAGAEGECTARMGGEETNVRIAEDGSFRVRFVVMSAPQKYDFFLTCSGENHLSRVLEYPPGEHFLGEI